MFLVKNNFNTIEIFFSAALIDEFISHYEFISVNTLLKEYKVKEEETKSPKNALWYNI